MYTVSIGERPRRDQSLFGPDSCPDLNFRPTSDGPLSSQKSEMLFQPVIPLT